jgi:hypothetical protein
MVAQLEIRDGTPWYNSQDIWVVPYDPNGPPGLPVVGKPAYLWALVHNTGMETAQNAVVTFYVADPSTNLIAQDFNTAQPNMDPDEAAQIIGGMVLTHQLTINLGGGTCPLVPDGHVNVI